jgi:hypothetical protein
MAATSTYTSRGSNLAVTWYIVASLAEDRVVSLPESDIQDAKDTYNLEITNHASLSVQVDPLAAAYAIRAMGKEAGLQIDPKWETNEDGSTKHATWPMGLKMLGVAVRIYRGEKPEAALETMRLKSLYNNIIDPSNPNFVYIDALTISAALNQRVGYGSKTLNDLTKRIRLDDGTYCDDGCYPAFVETIVKACDQSNKADGTRLIPCQYQAITALVVRDAFRNKKSEQYDPASYPVAP